MRSWLGLVGLGVALMGGCSTSGVDGGAYVASGGAAGPGAAPGSGGVVGAGGGAALSGGASGSGSAAATGGSTASGGTVAASGGASGSGGAIEGSGTGGGVSATGGAPSNLPPKFIGNIVHKNNDIIPDFSDKWMQVSMEANSKWGFVQPNSASDWVWGPVEAAYGYAQEHGIIYKEHAFFWNYEQPSWVTSDNVAASAEVWIQTFCEKFPDTVLIDVVNEPTYHAPPYKDGLGGDGASGYDWIVNAFELADQYCPNAILLINDYNIIEWPDDHDNFVAILQAVLAAGAPIDAIGAQGHDVADAGVPAAKEFIDHFTETFGLPVYITEFDVDRADDQEQLDIMQEAITMFWEHPNVHGITYWGFQEGLMWAPSAYLVSSGGTERPAMTWLMDFVAAHR